MPGIDPSFQFMNIGADERNLRRGQRVAHGLFPVVVQLAKADFKGARLCTFLSFQQRIAAFGHAMALPTLPVLKNTPGVTVRRP